VLMLAYMQSVSQQLACGTELVHIPTQGTLMSISGRYTSSIRGPEDKPNWIGVATLNTLGMLTASYSRHVGKKTDLSTEYSVAQTPDGTFQDMWAAGCQWTFRTSRIKARVDNQLHVGAVVEENITPFMRLSFVGDLDHKEQKYKFGVGLSLYM